MAFEKSTIVRAMNPMFKTLEAMAPGLGSVIAERLWCKIPKSSAAPVAKQGDLFSVRFNGLRVVAEKWGSGPAVYLMHGWGGRRGQLDSFVAPLVAAGYRVISLDAPGHGDSAPGAFGRGRGLLPEFSGALAAVVAAAGPAHSVIGHSLGGTATAIAMLDGLPVERAVTIAAMADPIPYTVEFAHWLGFGERIRKGFLRRLEQRIGRPMSDFDTLIRARAASSRALPPLLVVHDQQDREVYHRDGEALAMAWPQAQLVTTLGLGHRRILHDASVVSRVVEHLTPVRV